MVRPCTFLPNCIRTFRRNSTKHWLLAKFNIPSVCSWNKSKMGSSGEAILNATLIFLLKLEVKLAPVVLGRIGIPPPLTSRPSELRPPCRHTRYFFGPWVCVLFDPFCSVSGNPITFLALLFLSRKPLSPRLYRQSSPCSWSQNDRDSEKVSSDSKNISLIVPGYDLTTP